MDKIKIIFLDSLPSGKSGSCIFYDCNIYRTSSWNVIDISEICRANQEEWSNSLWEWHCNLTSLAARNDKYSCLLPGSRIHLWQTHVKTLIFCLGLKIYLQSTKEKELFIVGAPDEATLFLNDLFDGGFIIINKIGRRSNYSIIKLIHIFSLRLRNIGSIILRWKPFAWSRAYKYDCDVLVFSLFLTNKSVNYYNDHYFGKIFEQVQSKIFWLYKPSGNFNEKTARKSLSKLNGQFVFDYKLLNIWDLIWCLKNSILLSKHMKNLSKDLPKLKIGSVNCNTFSKRYFEKHFLEPLCFSEFGLLRATQTLLKYIKPKIICFPYEEKGIERAIIMASKTYLPKAKVVGFAHSAYNKAYLYLGEYKNSPKLPRPDIIWAAGNGFNSWLQNFWKRFDPVVNIGSNRYISESNEISTGIEKPILRVLIVVGNPSELYVFRNWIIYFPKLLHNCIVTIRPHPQGWNRENYRIGNELKKLGISRIDNQTSLSSQLNVSDLVLYSSSSAVIEAIQNGKLVAHVAWDELWCADPLRSASNYIHNCNTPEQLCEFINEVISMPPLVLQDLKKNQRKLANSIYSKFDSKMFDNLLIID